MIATILAVLLVGVIVLMLPVWAHSRTWGYYPSGLAALVLFVLLVAILI